MAGKFLLKKFADIDLGDSFFDSLKSDYPGNENSTGFVEWFSKKANEGSESTVTTTSIIEMKATTVTIKNTLKDTLHDFVYVKTKRNPMIIPIISEI